MNDTRRSGWYEDEAAMGILRRAMEIDQRRRDGLSEADLHHVARELDIAPASIVEAILESRGRGTTAMMAPLGTKAAGLRPFHAMPLITAGVAAATPLLITSITPLVSQSFILEPTIATMFAIQAAVVALATVYEGEAPHQRWHLSNLTTWFGFSAGFVFIGQRATTEFWPIVVGFGLMSALAGSTVLALMEALRNRAEVSASSGGSGNLRLISWKRTVVKRIKAFMDMRADMRMVPMLWMRVFPESKPDFT